MARSIVATACGLIVAFVIVFLAELIDRQLIPQMDGMPESGDEEAMRAFVAGLPVAALAAVLAGWTLAVTVGAGLASYFGRRGSGPGWAVTVLFLLTTIANFLMVPHPAWMVAAGVALIVAGGWIGTRFALRA